MRQVCGFWAMVVGLTLVAGLYLANTILYLTPPNPIKAQWLPTIYRLAHPFFAQNWHLFAPNPIRANYVLAVRCRRKAVVSTWHDLTQPLISHLHRRRSSPLARVLRVQQNAIRMALGIQHDEWRPLACRRDPVARACVQQSPADARRVEIGAMILGRAAGDLCGTVVEGGIPDAVQVRILIHTPPPWSRRHATGDDGHTRFVTLPWQTAGDAGR